MLPKQSYNKNIFIIIIIIHLTNEANICWPILSTMGFLFEQKLDKNELLALVMPNKNVDSFKVYFSILLEP